jgi:hypothetical protein
VVSYALEGAVVGNVASQLISLGAAAGLPEFRSLLARQLRGTSYRPA